MGVSPGPEPCVVLVRPVGPVNLGLVCRACANLGVDDLRVVRPGTELDQPDSRKFAMGGQALLKRARVLESLEEAVADCGLVIGTSARRRLGGKIPLVAPADLGGLIERRAPGRFAVVFGNEPDGLSNEELAACQICVRLETPGTFPSYNLSHAVVLVLYLLATCRPDPGAPVEGADIAATQASLRSLHAAWLDLLDRVGYFRRTSRERYAPVLKRLLDRLGLQEQDVHTLRGMLAQIGRDKIASSKDRK